MATSAIHGGDREAALIAPAYRTERRIDVVYDAFSDACSRLGDQGRTARGGYENRRHRRNRTHRKKGRDEPSSARPRSGGGIAIIGCQHRHRRGAGASACRRSGGRRCRECASWEDNAVLAFFETSGRNLLAAEAAAGVGHHVALSVVGTDRLLASGYFPRRWPRNNSSRLPRFPTRSCAHAVLRVRGRHRPIGDRRADGSASTGPDAAHCVG